jgi:hypothetical protein
MKKELTKPVSDKDDTAVNLYAQEQAKDYANSRCGAGCVPKNTRENSVCGNNC